MNKLLDIRKQTFYNIVDLMQGCDFMKEMLDILDENGIFTGGKKERSLVHEEGDWHKVVQIFQEELGIEAEKDKLKLVDTFKSPSIRVNNGKTIYNNHFVDLYISEQIIDLEKIHLQQEEVAQVKFYKISEFEKMVKSRDERLTDTPILFEQDVSRKRTRAFGKNQKGEAGI